jgi:hypothetical protein
MNVVMQENLGTFPPGHVDCGFRKYIHYSPFVINHRTGGLVSLRGQSGDGQMSVNEVSQVTDTKLSAGQHHREQTWFLGLAITSSMHIREHSYALRCDGSIMYPHLMIHDAVPPNFAVVGGLVSCSEEFLLEIIYLAVAGVCRFSSDKCLMKTIPLYPSSPTLDPWFFRQNQLPIDPHSRKPRA